MNTQNHISALPQELAEYAKLLLSNGFRLMVSTSVDRPTWIHFEKGGKVGYCSFEKWRGFNFSTIHKPSKEVGTGYRILSGIETPTTAHAEKTLVERAEWAHRKDAKYVKKYASLDEYADKNAWCSPVIIEPVTTEV